MRSLIRPGAVAGALLLTSAGLAGAGVISGWDMDLVVTDPPPYTLYETYYSTLFTDGSLSLSNGVISWKETDVQAPGMKVVNGDDVDGTNCLMTTGYNPSDGSDKQCSDPLQSSKRFKLKNTLNAPLDVQYLVVDGPLSTYRSLQKWTDGTDRPWTGFSIELGFMVNGEFVPSAAGDGLGFSDTRGRFFDRPISTYQSKEDVFSALFAQGLAGPADKYHPEPGYFNPLERMSFAMIGTEDLIVSDGVSATYSDVFGQWLNSDGVPIAIFYDDDGDILTDNILMANCADPGNLVHLGVHSGDDVSGFVCEGQWVTFRSSPGLDGNGVPYPSDGVPKAISLSELAPVVYDGIEAAMASGDPNPMYMDYIEDAANLGFNFWITVDDNTQWPTPGQFTIRYTPVALEAPNSPEALCDDGIDNDSDGLVDCADADCSDDAACTVIDPEVCNDGVDNDGDGYVDCDDLDCSADPACAVTVDPEVCDDGLDNDGDGWSDCADPDCDGVGLCGAEGKFDTCSDGFDNDGDGQVDCDDSGCARNRSCR